MNRLQLLIKASVNVHEFAVSELGEDNVLCMEHVNHIMHPDALIRRYKRDTLTEACVADVGDFMREVDKGLLSSAVLRKRVKSHQLTNDPFVAIAYAAAHLKPGESVYSFWNADDNWCNKGLGIGGECHLKLENIDGLVKANFFRAPLAVYKGIQVALLYSVTPNAVACL